MIMVYDVDHPSHLSELPDLTERPQETGTTTVCLLRCIFTFFLGYTTAVNVEAR